MPSILSIAGLGKTYASGQVALDVVPLDIYRGEFFALLGPNGAGKETLTSIVCGIVTPSGGAVRVDGRDIQRDFRGARASIGPVPHILFLDEPTAGVDVELRRDTWQMVRGLQATGVTIILTTHYVEEAEEMVERIDVLDKGRLILVQDKMRLMQELGK